MISIPFLKTAVRRRTRPKSDKIRPDLDDTIRQAWRALRNGLPSRALSLVAPFFSEGDVPDDARLVAGRAYEMLGRHPEAIGNLELYLALHPNSVEGLLTAGLAAAGAGELAKAADWFSRAARSLGDRAGSFLEPLGESDKTDPVTIEEMVAEAEAHPEDRDRALAVACALGKAGHFKAAERFLPLL